MTTKPIIYSTPTCAQCRQVKKLLNIKHIEYTEIDVSNLPKLHQEIAEKAGSSRVPIVQYGSKFTVGFNPGLLIELLKIKNK